MPNTNNKNSQFIFLALKKIALTDPPLEKGDNIHPMVLIHASKETTDIMIHLQKGILWTQYVQFREEAPNLITMKKSPASPFRDIMITQ